MMQADFDRHKQWWDEKAVNEETDLADEAINRALRWREIERCLEGVRTILEVGGGTVVFSIPLAKRGYDVTYLDLSSGMLELARSKAEGLPNISFVVGNGADLSSFMDSSFDLVLNMDGAISFSGSMAEAVILESCRVTRKRLLVTVSHRARLLPLVVWASLQVTGRLLPAVYAMLEAGEWHQDKYPENPLLTKGMTQDYMPSMKAFLPGELRGILERAGMQVLRCGGLGTLADFCKEETIKLLLERKDEKLFEDFLDLCERFDREILPDGPGTWQRAGLIAVEEKQVLG